MRFTRTLAAPVAALFVVLVPFASPGRAQSLLSVQPVASANPSGSAEAPSLLMNAGDPVDYFTAGRWIPCTVTGPLANGAYPVQCGSLDFRARPSAAELRPRAAAHVTLGLLAQPPVAAEPPPPETAGARFGTREPRTCEDRRQPITDETARDLFICATEREQEDRLYLVSEVMMQLSPPRSFDLARDSNRPGIDPKQPLYDLRGAYNSYQCRRIGSAYHDFPGTHNCDVFPVTDALGSCFRDLAGEWHYSVDAAHQSTVATAVNVRAPVLE